MGGHALIRKADRALYEAKEKGKNRLCVRVKTNGRGGYHEIKY